MLFRSKRNAVREVVKYATKVPDKLTPEQIDALGRATRGRRLVAARGCCRSRLDTKETNDATEAGLLARMPCTKCHTQLQFLGFVPTPRPGDPDAVPDYDFRALDAARRRAGPPLCS